MYTSAPAYFPDPPFAFHEGLVPETTGEQSCGCKYGICKTSISLAGQPSKESEPGRYGQHPCATENDRVIIRKECKLSACCVAWLASYYTDGCCSGLCGPCRTLVREGIYIQSEFAKHTLSEMYMYSREHPDAISVFLPPECSAVVCCSCCGKLEG